MGKCFDINRAVCPEERYKKLIIGYHGNKVKEIGQMALARQNEPQLPMEIIGEIGKLLPKGGKKVKKQKGGTPEQDLIRAMTAQ